MECSATSLSWLTVFVEETCKVAYWTLFKSSGLGNYWAVLRLILPGNSGSIVQFEPLSMLRVFNCFLTKFFTQMASPSFKCFQIKMIQSCTVSCITHAQNDVQCCPLYPLNVHGVTNSEARVHILNAGELLL